jgi:hypothetical protein
MSKRGLAAEKAWRTRRKKARKLSKAARKAWETRLSKWEELRSSILLIECIPEKDIDCSEGKMLEQLFRIINLQMSDNREKVDLATAKGNTPEDLLRTLRKAEQSCIHISCHGQFYKSYGKTGLKLPEGRLFSDGITSKDETSPIWNERVNDKKQPIPQLVFLSACETAHEKDMVERFMQAGVRYVIAPRKDPRFSDAALFASIFYPLVYVEQKNPLNAFKKVKKAFPAMTGNWKFFDMYKHNFGYYDPNGTGKL